VAVLLGVDEWVSPSLFLIYLARYTRSRHG
jgi:hypothetical protein